VTATPKPRRKPGRSIPDSQRHGPAPIKLRLSATGLAQLDAAAEVYGSRPRAIAAGLSLAEQFDAALDVGAVIFAREGPQVSVLVTDDVGQVLVQGAGPDAGAALAACVSGKK
jgi:hypothetical protein